MRRVLFLPVAAVALLSLAACVVPAAPPAPGAAPQGAAAAPTAMPEKPPEKLTIWFYDSVTPAATEWLQKVMYQFAAEKDVDVEIYHAPEQAFIEKTAAAVESGQLPDVWITWGNSLPGLLNAGAIADLSDVVADLDKQAGGLVDGAKPAMTFDGKQWGIPVQVWADAWYVRKDLGEAKGVEPPTTYEEAVAYAKAVADPTVPVYGWGMHVGPACSSDPVAEINTLIWSHGGSVWGEDGTTVTLKSPETIAALELVKDAWDSGAMAPDAVNWDCYSNNACYLEGTCAMIQNAGSVYIAMRDGDPDLLAKTTIVTDPAGPAGQHNYTSYEPWVMSATSQNPELAKEFLRYMYEPDRQLEFMRLLGGFNFPIYKDHASDELWSDPYLQPFLETSKHSHTGGWPGPITAWQLEAERQGVLQTMMGNILVDGWEVERAIDDAVTKLEEIRDSMQ